MEVHLAEVLLVLVLDNIQMSNSIHRTGNLRKNQDSFSEGRLAGLDVSFHPVISLSLPDKKKRYSDLVFLILVFL